MQQYNSENAQDMSSRSRELSLPRREPLTVTEDSVSFLGVELRKQFGGAHAPSLERFASNVLTKFDLELMQKIAIAFELNQPILVESGSGLGKTETVERMCALLGWDCYYANCHDFEPDVLLGSKTVREDTKSGFGWKDGIVVQAIRNGGVLYLDEYNFMRGETRGRLHEVLDAVLRGKEELVLIENDGERVKVHPDLRIVCSQNPPGGRFSDREILDPAQFTRFVYIKEASEMPKDMKRARALGFLGEQEKPYFPRGQHLAGAESRSRTQLSADSEFKEIVEKFLEFEEGLKRLVEEGAVGYGQPQPVYFAFQRDFKRLMEFAQRFHDGNNYSTIKKALHYYYVNRFESQADRDKVRELLNTVIRPSPEQVPPRLSLPETPNLDSDGQGSGALAA